MLTVPISSSTVELEVAQVVERDLLPMISDSRNAIFLVGRDLKTTGSIRAELHKMFDSGLYKHTYRVMYPEVLFSEFVYQNDYDMLTLENALAFGVRAVVVCVESPGSFAELGAFCNNELLSRRIVVVCESRYKKANSFLNRGPIRYIQRLTGSVMWFERGDPQALPVLMRKLRMEVAARPRPEVTITNPVLAENFVLPYLCVAGPLSRKELVAMVQRLSPSSDSRAEIACGVALAVLFRQREVRLEGDRYAVTPKGIERLLTVGYGRKLPLLRTLDALRTRILNSRLKT